MSNLPRVDDAKPVIISEKSPQIAPTFLSNHAISPQETAASSIYHTRPDLASIPSSVRQAEALSSLGRAAAESPTILRVTGTALPPPPFLHASRDARCRCSSVRLGPLFSTPPWTLSHPWDRRPGEDVCLAAISHASFFHVRAAAHAHGHGLDSTKPEEQRGRR